MQGTSGIGGALRLFACGLFCLVATSAGLGDAREAPFDVVIEGGRVMDPDTNFDRVASIGIRNGEIAAITTRRIRGERTIDARGLVVSPGFIDLHAHGQNLVAADLQAQDGVTTALDLEVGAYPINSFYAAREGRARINFGASVSHQGIRIKVKTGEDLGHSAVNPERGGPLLARQSEWAAPQFTAEEVEQGLRLFREEVAAGGLGLGLTPEYTPGADRREVYVFMREAATLDAPVFVHVRAAHHPGVGGLFEMVQEVMADAAATGASLHLCHVTSKGLNDTSLILEAIAGAQRNGLDITTEAYPYTAGSTAIGSALFNEGWQERWDSDYDDIEWPSTGERLTRETFDRYRRDSPGSAIIFHMIPESAMDTAIANPIVIIASDGGTYAGGAGHPRGAGTFSRVLGHYVRERDALSLMDALRKMTIMPARRLEQIAPAMRRKGRLQVGMDADITVFDPATITDRATYSDSMRPSVGVRYVLVGGVEVVSDGALRSDVFPGRGVRSAAHR